MTRQDDAWKNASLARTYLEGVRGAIPLAGEQLDVVLRLIAARGEGVQCLADLGCGDGILARTILLRHPNATAVLVDFSEPMLRQARSQLAGDRVGTHFVEADLGEPEWVEAIARHAPFDVVVSGYAIHHQPDSRKRELYREVFALLEPDGLFINTEHVASRTRWVESISDELFIDSLYAFQRRTGSGESRERVAEKFFHRPDKAANILAPVETQCEWLREIGFEDVDCYFKLFELAVFGGRKPQDRVARTERL